MAKNLITVEHKSKVRNNWKEAEAAVNFWQALEYLAPQSPPAVKLDESVWEFESDASEDELPWSDPKKQAILDRQIGANRRFQLYAGIIDGPYFIETARQYLGADSIDQAEMRPPSPAACVVINVDGKGLASGQLFVSTVPWAMAQISSVSGTDTPLNFRGFFGSDGLEEKIREKVQDLMVARRLFAKKPEGGLGQNETSVENPGTPAPAKGSIGSTTPPLDDTRRAPAPVRPITSEDVRAITALVFALSGWLPEQQEKWRVQAHWAPAKESGDADSVASQDDPLNSFYAEDLEELGDAIASRDIGTGLKAYLRGQDSTGRIDLESDVSKLIYGVYPSRLPPGCWPSKHPLVTAQQFAVNTVMQDLALDGGLFSVNGPPGTGKTTMLKDIVAAVVVNRADVMVDFDTPASAFKRRLEIEDYQYPVYELDARLRGFGIVVSSANNGAVENITKELPGLAAIADDVDIDYFSKLADSAAAPPKAKRRPTTRQRWGLITAVLGNKSNRNQFASRFWLSGLQKKPKEGQPAAELDPLRLRSLQDLVKSGDHGALSWEEARRQYREARRKVDALTAMASHTADAMRTCAAAQRDLSEAHAALAENRDTLDGQIEAAHHAKTRLEAAHVAYERAEQWVSLCTNWSDADAHLRSQQKAYEALSEKVAPTGVEQARSELERAVAAVRSAQEDIEFHHRSKPGFLSELFRTQYSRQWNAYAVDLEGQLRKARTKETRAVENVANEEVLARKLDGQKRALVAASERSANCRTKACLAGLPLTDNAGSAVDADLADGMLASLMEGRDKAASIVRRLRSEAATAQRLVDATRANIAADQKQMARAEAELEAAQKILAASQVPPDKLPFWDLAALGREGLHCAVPYDFPSLFRARREVFVAAMKLHQAFIVAAWNPLSRSLSAFVNLLQGNLNVAQITKGPIHLWDAFFLVVPVVSTTFASFPRLFRGIGSEQLAWLMIDEAGQAAPQQAAGAIWRSKRSVIVGDPLQLEPVVGVPKELMTPLLLRCSAEPQWAPPLTSAQTLADRANRFGMYLGDVDSDERIWLGSPLLVHRRCLDPMFRIANSIAYDNKMVYGAGEDSGSHGIGPSCWVHVPAKHSDGHWVEAQAKRTMELVEEICAGDLMTNGQFKVYVITPFRTVAEKIRRQLYLRYGEKSKGMSGTVHTFQGKEAENVVLLLGGNPSSPGVISSFAGAKPNLVNVAVTRAKRRLYVVGDHGFWTGASDVHRIFTRMAEHLAEDATDTEVAA
ncbi:AAA domain-containing protein [Cupriavidus plantarum]|nr:hypothetical protein LMG26296_03611 [Cupriavidus plantarum]SMR85978.1 Part of AAA domain-containing protein [Cupriavidus plantarum]